MEGTIDTPQIVCADGLDTIPNEKQMAPESVCLEGTLVSDQKVTSAETVLSSDKQDDCDKAEEQGDKQMTSAEVKTPDNKQMEPGNTEEETKEQSKPHVISAKENVLPYIGCSVKSSDIAGGDKNVDELSTVATKPDVHDKKVARESARSKRKEDKAIDLAPTSSQEHVLKALSSLETTEEKLAALCKKYTELLDEHRLLQNTHKQMQKKLNQLSREKDQLQSEQSKTVLAKSKLESLCRELQKHNKIIKDESVARAKEEEEKRKEVTAKFQATINDIQQQMNENYEKNNKLRIENMELANKLKNLIEQYELREQHIEKLFKHKELELQLVEAKLAQANVQRTEEQERFIKEKQQILEAACLSQKKVEAQEKQLRSQVALYTDKYEEFQSTLAKSNEVFQSFKSEMDTMTKKIKKLEKETVMWRTRWESSNTKLIEMAEYKARSDKETAVLKSKIQKLENLCRALQDERKKLAARIPNEEAVGINGIVQKQESSAEPTKTPPNTPEGGTSRGSPVIVEEKAEAISQETASQLDSEPKMPAQKESQSEAVPQSDIVPQVADDQSVTVPEVNDQSELASQGDSKLDALPQDSKQSEDSCQNISEDDAVCNKSAAESDVKCDPELILV